MRVRTGIGLAVAALAFAGVAIHLSRPRPAPVTTAPADPYWALAPTDIGEDLPPAGRSLFDHVVADGRGGVDIPFPFAALLRKIEARAGCTPNRYQLASCLKIVFIPLGRSLQRTVAAPDYFAAPRVVVAVDGEPRTGTDALPLLKDRLYLGFNEAAGTIEVISYNDTAGRFEFQIVRDYRAGATPDPRYASRALCTACHQNQAPIFSRPTWDETDANPAVAARLREHGADFHGVHPGAGIDIPNAIDDATDRANLLGVTQRLWREGCAAPQASQARRCRAELLRAALRYRLSDEHDFDSASTGWQQAVRARFDENGARRWPAGLALPNPDIPNRDPLPALFVPSVSALADIPARFDPLAPRDPRDIWRARETDLTRRAVTGVAAFFAGGDIRRLRQRSFAAVSSALDRLLDAAERGSIDTLDDMPLRRAAVMPFLFSELGLEQSYCCNTESALPAARALATDDTDVALAQLEPGARLLYPYCAACHREASDFPPGFLHGDAAQVRAQLRHCAPRIHYRLTMAQLPAATRAKTPMPPAAALARAHPDTSDWSTSHAYADMLAYFATELRAQQIVPLTPEDTADTAYEDLRPCLPRHQGDPS